MIKITDILSKPVISLLDSKTEGIINNAIFDKTFKRLKWLIMFDNNEHLEEKALNTNDIYSYGENAIVIKDSNLLNLEISCKEINDKTLPINNSVYTYLGKYIGKVTDILLDEKYYIKYILVGQTQVDITNVISCGADAVIIQDDEKRINIKTLKRKRTNAVKITELNTNNENKVVILNTDSNSNLNEIQPIILDENINKTEPELIKTKNKYELSDTPSVPKIVATNYGFLIGRKMEKNIYSQNKELIAKKNTKITTDIINKAKLYYKIRELTKYSR